MRNHLAACVVLFAAACSGPAARPVPRPEPQPQPPPEPVAVTPPTGPRQPPPQSDDKPPVRLPRLFLPTSYRAELGIDPDKATFDGRIDITGTVAQSTDVIWLYGNHLAIHDAIANSAANVAVALTVTPRSGDRLELHASAPLTPGTWRVEINYTAQIDALQTMGAFKEQVGAISYVYTQFESIGARRAFPCLDEPDNKVPWTLALDVPAGDLAVTNTPIAKEADLAGGGKHFEFAETKPLPSYLIAFGVGPFDVVPGGKTKSGVPVRIIAPRGRGNDAAYAAANTAKIVDLLEAWIGIPYAFGKLDMMAIPLTTGFGAMENAGLVTFQESLLLFDPKHASWGQRAGFVSVAAHELAHQWFGDLVTTAWWDDIWLNEGFADWMETKISAEFDPQWHFDLDEVDMRKAAQGADSLVTARRVRQPILSVDDIMNAFDGITYTKGASVLRMFETYVGEPAFQRGIRDYLNARKFSNATAADFIAALSKASGKDLAPAFATLLDQPGLPQLTFDLQCGGGPPKLAIAQRRYVGDGAPASDALKPWILPVCVAFDNAGRRDTACTLIDQPTQSIELKTKACPKWLAPNVAGRGYYRADLTEAQAMALRDAAWRFLTPAEQLVTALDVDVSATTAHAGTKLPVALALSFVPKLLAQGNRFAVFDSDDLLQQLSRDTPDDLASALAAWRRKAFGPMLDKLGTLPRPSDDLDAEASRNAVYTEVVWHGRDPKRVAQAVAAAAKWRDLPVQARGYILMAAVDASPELQAAVRADVMTEADVVRTRQALMALAAIRDPARLTQALGAMLDPQLDFRKSLRMLGAGEPATARVRQDFFRAHAQELLERLPKNDATGSAVYAFAGPFFNACDAAHRDEDVRYASTTLAAIPGAPRVLAQLTERLDRCIATKKLLEPEVAAWLRTATPATPSQPSHPH